VALAFALVAEGAFAGPNEGAKSLDRLKAGRLVHVTTKTPPSFDAIWIGRDGDRALFERLHPEQTVAVRVDALLDVHELPRARPNGDAGAWGFLGGVAGFVASLFWIRGAFVGY
jgi:hypothetical protein